MQQADTQQPPWLALFSICLAAFLVPMAMAAVNLALPSIADDLHIDAVYLSWVPSAPLWGSVVLMLPIARLADLYGRRRIHLHGLALYTFSTAVVVWVDQIEWLLFSGYSRGWEVPVFLPQPWPWWPAWQAARAGECSLA